MYASFFSQFSNVLLLTLCSKVKIWLSTLQVRIVVIDSVTFHFRQDFEDLALRTRVLSGLSLKLMKIAKTYNLAVSYASCV